MNNLTQEQIEDIKNRNEEWIKKGEELQLAVIAYPQLVQNEKGNFEITCVVRTTDTKYMAQPSPFVSDNK